MITKRFLLSEISYRYPDAQAHLVHADGQVDRPLLFNRDETRPAARIYLADATQLDQALPDKARDALFLCIGKPCSDTLSRFDMCVFPETTDQSRLFNFVQRVFDRLDGWERSMRRLAQRGAGAEEMLDCAADMLQNPVFLCDASGRICAASERYLAQSEPISDQTSYKMTHALGDCAALCDAALRVSPNGMDEELLLHRFMLDQSAFTIVLLARDRAFYESDEAILTQLSGYLRLALPAAGAHEQARLAGRRESILHALMTEGTTGERDWQSALFPTKPHAYACLALAVASGDYRPARTHGACARLEQALTGSTATLIAQEIIWIVPCEREEANVRQLENLAAKEGLRGGISEVFAQAESVVSAIRQAQAAAGCQQDPANCLRAFSGVAADVLTDAMLRDLPITAACLPSVVRMRRYDLMHQSKYCQTVRAYCLNRFNARKTANALYIHRSTFLYRMERVRELFGVSPDDETDLMRLLLSLQLAERIEQ